MDQDLAEERKRERERDEERVWPGTEIINLFELSFSFHFSYLWSAVRLVSLKYLIFLLRFTASLITSSSPTLLELSFLWTDRTHTAVGERMVWRGNLRAVCFRCILFFTDHLCSFNVDIIMSICSILLERMDYVSDGCRLSYSLSLLSYIVQRPLMKEAATMMIEYGNLILRIDYLFSPLWSSPSLLMVWWHRYS